jgi:hypothetical protein
VDSVDWGSVERIELAQDRSWWLTLVNTVIILQVLAPRIFYKPC